MGSILFHQSKLLGGLQGSLQQLLTLPMAHPSEIVCHLELSKSVANRSAKIMHMFSLSLQCNWLPLDAVPVQGICLVLVGIFCEAEAILPPLEIRHWSYWDCHHGGHTTESLDSLAPFWVFSGIPPESCHSGSKSAIWWRWFWEQPQEKPEFSIWSWSQPKKWVEIPHSLSFPLPKFFHWLRF